MASPDNIDIASGRNIPISTPSAASGTKRPLEVIDERKSGPCPGCGVDDFTAMAMTTGTAARTSRPAWLRRRPAMMRSSERSNRVDSRRPFGRGCAMFGAAPVATCASAADIEALPRERDEQVLEARRARGERAHPDSCADQRGDDGLGFDFAGYAAHLTRVRRDRLDAEAGQHHCSLLRLGGDEMQGDDAPTAHL